MPEDNPLQQAAAFTWRALVVSLGVVVTVVALARLRVLVIPVIVALLLSTVLVPPVNRLHGKGIPRLLATWMVLLASLGTVIGAIVLVAPSVADEFTDLGATVQAGIGEVQNWLVEGPLELSRDEIDRYTDQFVDQVRSSGSSIASGVLAGAILAGEVVAGLLLVLVLLFFFVKDGAKMCAFGLSQVRPKHRELAEALGSRAWSVTGAYVRGTALVALVDALIIGVGLFLIGVPLVFPLALLTFFGAFFPLVGAVAAGSVAVLVALVTGGLTDALLALAVVVVVQQVEGDVLAPLVLGRAVRLHPVVIIGALTAGAVIGGLIGAFLAVPLAAVAVAVGGELKSRNIIGPGAPNGSEPPQATVHLDEGPEHAALPAGDPVPAADRVATEGAVPAEEPLPEEPVPEEHVPVEEPVPEEHGPVEEPDAAVPPGGAEPAGGISRAEGAGARRPDGDGG